MFSNKPYLEVNREERFFCALLAHALLSSPCVRSRFVELIRQNGGPQMGSGDLDVFIEVAALRDYWWELGRPKGRGSSTDREREQVVRDILVKARVELDVSLVGTNELFRTEGKNKNIRFPGQWKLSVITSMNVPNEAKEKLRNIRYAFNAKPDMLIIAGQTALLVETKVESGEGRDGGAGYNQYETQRHIAHFLKLLVPWFAEFNFRHVLIAMDDSAFPNAESNMPEDEKWIRLPWGAVCTMVLQDSEVDVFTNCAFKQLQKRSRERESGTPVNEGKEHC